ncbi:MAG TPA: hypothetical protein VHP83_13150 [Aggregatilineaceae bacterium]|nr:hypothetical protein [Aggregatilineaceae bacterium]
MMRKVLALVVIVLLVAALTPSVPAKAIGNAVGSLSLSCDSITVNMEYDVDRDNTGASEEYHGYYVVDALGNLLYADEYYDDLGDHWHDNYTDSFDSAPVMDPIKAVHISWEGNGYAEQIIYSTSYDCPTIPTFAGEDQVEIPSQAAVGQILSDTPVYSAPKMDAASTTVLTAGKTIWIYGLDESGQFYRGMMAGRFFWVPANLVGPNYDKVWNGRALPTNVVR